MLTYKFVLEAVQALKELGIPISLRNVRDYIGGGSLSEILKHLKIATFLSVDDSPDMPESSSPEE
jgi:hypothetical protein